MIIVIKWMFVLIMYVLGIIAFTMIMYSVNSLKRIIHLILWKVEEHLS